MAETPAPTAEDPNAVLVPYEAPDISEITGIEEPEEGAEAEPTKPATTPATK